jgi:hypothetical protein
MICRLYGEETSTHFLMEWFMMAYTMVKIGKVFNWAHILHSTFSRRLKKLQV